MSTDQQTGSKRAAMATASARVTHPASSASRATAAPGGSGPRTQGAAPYASPVGQAAHDGKALEPAVVAMYAQRHGLDLHAPSAHRVPAPSNHLVTNERQTPPRDQPEAPTGHYEIKVVFSAAVAPTLPESGVDGYGDRSRCKLGWCSACTSSPQCRSLEHVTLGRDAAVVRVALVPPRTRCAWVARCRKAIAKTRDSTARLARALPRRR